MTDKEPDNIQIIKPKVYPISPKWKYEHLQGRVLIFEGVPTKENLENFIKRTVGRSFFITKMPTDDNKEITIGILSRPDMFNVKIENTIGDYYRLTVPRIKDVREALYLHRRTS